jgi:hypothetical protein
MASSAASRAHAYAASIATAAGCERQMWQQDALCRHFAEKAQAKQASGLACGRCRQQLLGDLQPPRLTRLRCSLCNQLHAVVQRLEGGHLGWRQDFKPRGS